MHFKFLGFLWWIQRDLAIMVILFTFQRPTVTGISLGGILGGGYVSFSKQFERATFSVPGSPFALLLPRCEMFPLINFMLRLSLPEQRDVRLALSLFQVLTFGNTLTKHNRCGGMGERHLVGYLRSLNLFSYNVS